MKTSPKPSSYWSHSSAWLCLAALVVVVMTGGCGDRVSSSQSIDLVGQQFPMLLVWSPPADPEDPSGQGPLPCNNVRALRVDELDAKVAPLVETVTLDCEVGKGIEDEPDGITTVVAKLKPNAANFGGVPIVEIRMMDSAWGNDHQYLLDAPFNSSKETITASIRQHCLGNDPSSNPGSSTCVVTPEDMHKGIYIDRGEGGGLWAHPDPDDAQRTIFASAWSE